MTPPYSGVFYAYPPDHLKQMGRDIYYYEIHCYRKPISENE